MPALVVALVTVALLALIAFACSRPSAAPGRRKPDEDDGGDDGGSKPRVPPRNPPSAPDDEEPEWWRDFERDFAEYARGAGSRRAGRP